MRATLRARLSGARCLPQALGVLLLVAIALPVAAHARAWVHPELESARAAAGPGEELGVRVVLARRDLPPLGALRRQRIFERQARVLASLPAARLRVRYRHRVLSGFSDSVRPDVIEVLARHPEVVSIHPDRLKRATLAQGGALVSAPQVHAAGPTGEGVRVAVLDTGIDTDHPYLVDDLVAEYCACDTSFLPFVGACCPNGLTRQTGPGSAEDGDGHGTSVAGIITSAHPTRRGVAPDAGVVAVKVLSDSGTGLDSGIDAGLDWVLDNRETYGIRVVNMSLGDGGEYASPNLSPCSSDPTSLAIASLHAAGVAVFVASGNDGHDAGISAPACTAEAISVGGVYDAAVGSVSWCANESCTQTLCTDVSAPDGFVCHSNSGAILDILAPNFRTGTTGLDGGVDSDFGGTSASSACAAA